MRRHNGSSQLLRMHNDCTVCEMGNQMMNVCGHNENDQIQY